LASALPRPELAEGLAKDRALSDYGIDSLGLLQVIAGIESTFGIKVLDEDLDDQNFTTLASLDRWLDTKLPRLAG
jgi:acyl carrier protein